MKFLKDKIFKLISEIAHINNTEVYIVGGFVRDYFLARNSKDIDILVVGDGINFAKLIRNEIKGFVKLTIFKNFRTANLKTNSMELEFVGARKESYNRGSRNPVVEEGSLKDDIQRRDFTINSLAISLNSDSFGDIVDLFGGRADLKKKLIKTPLNPDKTFSDDPLRIMRAIRFATQLNFDIEQKTLKSIHENATKIKIISQERITEELNKIILSEKPSIGLKLLHEVGLLKIMLPELVALEGIQTVDNKSHKDNFLHSLQVLDNICYYTDNLWLRWAALIHDVGKAKTKKYDSQKGWTFYNHDMIGAKMVSVIFKRLKLPLNEKMKYVEKIVSLHLRPISLTFEIVSDSAIRRFIVEAGEVLNDLLIHSKADITSENKNKVDFFKKKFDQINTKIKIIEKNDELRNWKNPISGKIIMEVFGIPPSKKIGDIKSDIKEAIMSGKIKNNYEQAYEYMIDNYSGKL